MCFTRDMHHVYRVTFAETDLYNCLFRRGVAHRDLKLENLLLASPDDITDIKVTRCTLTSLLPATSLFSSSTKSSDCLGTPCIVG